jgi:hypothetical protein
MPEMREIMSVHQFAHSVLEALDVRNCGVVGAIG